MSDSGSKVHFTISTFKGAISALSQFNWNVLLCELILTLEVGIFGYGYLLGICWFLVKKNLLYIYRILSYYCHETFSFYQDSYCPAKAFQIYWLPETLIPIQSCIFFILFIQQSWPTCTQFSISLDMLAITVFQPVWTAQINPLDKDESKS